MEKPGHQAKAVMECLLDTGGAKTMIDLGTARKAGLPLVYPTKERHLGFFYGPSGEPTAYAAVVEGPVHLRFGADVVLAIPELKVVHNKDPIILVGTDVMRARPSEKLGGWGFHYVGLEPRSRAGVVQFYKLRREKLQLRTQHLFCWPTEDLPAPPATQRGPPASAGHALATTTASLAPRASAPTPRHLTLLTSDAAAASGLVSEAAALSRLLTRQGQWV